MFVCVWGGGGGGGECVCMRVYVCVCGRARVSVLVLYLRVPDCFTALVMSEGVNSNTKANS